MQENPFVHAKLYICKPVPSNSDDFLSEKKITMLLNMGTWHVFYFESVLILVENLFVCCLAYGLSMVCPCQSCSS